MGGMFVLFCFVLLSDDDDGDDFFILLLHRLFHTYIAISMPILHLCLLPSFPAVSGPRTDGAVESKYAGRVRVSVGWDGKGVWEVKAGLDG